ncbi:hypothetical protein ULB03_00845 [Nitrospirillum sp. BR 11828]|nr:hypothetical protein [Nitrospirillum sp. BR 11828]MDZ5645705.1 hypothetical protein [Nitrospirillum sp. BR 11828]
MSLDFGWTGAVGWARATLGWPTGGRVAIFSSVASELPFRAKLKPVAITVMMISVAAMTVQNSMLGSSGRKGASTPRQCTDNSRSASPRR